MDKNLLQKAKAPMIALIQTKNIMKTNNLKTKTKRTFAPFFSLFLSLFAIATTAQAQAFGSPSRAIDECKKPTYVTISEIGTSNATLSWTENGEATEWQIMLNDDYDNLIQAPTNPFTLTNLTPGTEYTVKVTPWCEMEKWSDERTFTTQCGPITITADAPYTQGFESPEGTAYDAQGPLPDCWDGPGDFAPHNTVFANSHGGSQSLSFYHPRTYVIGYVRYALLPEFSNPLHQLQISFYLSAEKQNWSHAYGSIALGYITAEDDGTCNTFTAIETYEYTLSSWEQRTTMLWLVPTAAQRLVFKAEGNNIIFYVDDLEVSVMSIDCYPVSNLSVDNVTTTSATLDWELLDESQTEWNVQVATNADFTENLTHYVADIHENFALSNLSPSTRYYVRVKPSCSETLWSSTLDFLTLCEPITITADAPYFEDFQNYAQFALPDCWEAYTIGNTAPFVNMNLDGSKFLSFEYTSFAILPEFSNPLSELQISFYMKNLGGQLQVGYITAEDDGTCNTFTAIATYDLASSWVQRITYMFDVPATAQRLVFKCDNVHGYCSIDNVEVAVVPLGFCYPVKALSLGEVFYSTAYLSWELVDESQTEWDVQVATNEDFTENVANYVADNHENFLINGLTGNTTYYVRVKPTCSEDHWSDLKSFTTLCGYDITLETPYTEGFESPQGVGTINYGLDGPLPSCWEAHTTSETNALDPYIYNDPNYPVYHEGSQCLIFDYKDNSYAILPEFSNALNELQISFWMKIQTNSGSINIDQLSLGYITADDDGTCNTFTEIESYTQANVWEQRTLALDGVPAEAHRLAFRWSVASSMRVCFIDDVTVSINPAMLPHNIAAVNITNHEADITWEGLCDSYALRYQQVSLAPEPLLNEGFEGGTMPQGWTIEGASQDPSKTWRVGVGDYSTGTGTHSGSYNALITHNTNNQVTYLVTPAIDLGGYGSAELSFWYINRKWINDIDEFAVCYRISSEGEWNELWNTTENHQAWTSQTVALTGLASNYQIGFRFTDHYGYGVGLDDIALSGVVLSEWITVSEAESPYTLTGLTPETTYEVQVQGTYGSSTLDWSESVTFTTLEACPVPFNVSVSDITPTEVAISWTGYSDSYNLSYRRVPSTEPETILNEGFEGGTMPQGWIIEGASQDPAKTWRVGVGDHFSETGTHSGNYNALITHNTSNQVTYLVMPALDLGEYGSAELSFWYVNCIWSGDIDEFAVCYRIGNEGEWNELWNTTENHQAWTSQTVALTGLASNYQIGFRFTDHYGYGVGLDDIALSGVSSNPSWITLSEAESPQTIAGLRPETEYEVKVQGVCDGIPTEWSQPVTFTTLEACPIPFDVEVSGIAATEATVSWTGYSDSYNLSYRRVPSTTPETILNEGFEGGTMPQGWIIEGASQDPAKTWRVGVGDHFSETGTHSGNYNALITHNARNQVTYLVMPALDLGEYGSAELSFWYINKRWGNDTDEFGVCYRIGNEGEWNELWNTTDYHYAWTSQSVALTGLADNYQIGFRFTDHYGYGVGLDDIALSGVFSNPSWITLSEAESPQAIASLRPETEYEVKVQGVCDGIPTEWSQPIAFSTLACTVPGNLAVSDITATGATLTWTGTSVDYNVQLGVIAGSIAIVDEDFSEAIPTSWDNGSNYPWTIVDGHMQSSNGGIHSTSSAISLTMTFPVGGTIEFDAECKGEGSSTIYDKCIFTIDGEQQFCYGANMPGWNHYSYTVDAGTHTFTWSYTKDGSVNPTGDYFAVDNVVVAVGECIWEEPLLANGESITLSALTPSTTYYARVQGICDGISTDWSNTVRFTTADMETLTKDIVGYGNSAGGWYLIASPVVEAVTPTAENGFLTNEYDLYFFDQSQILEEWQNWKLNNFNLVSGKGYLYASQENTTLVFSGTPHPATDPVEVPLDYDGSVPDFAGWNLVGNPFPTMAFIADGRPFYTVNGDGSQIIGVVSHSIEVMEAIFVVAEEDGETMTFTTEMPALGASLSLNVMAAEPSDTPTHRAPTVVDRAIIRFDEGRQLPKFQLNGNSTKVYIPQGSMDYAVVCSEGKGEQPLNFKAAKNGTYTLSVNVENMDFNYLHLIDNLTGADIDLLAVEPVETPTGGNGPSTSSGTVASYTFTAKTTDYESRFKLVFSADEYVCEPNEAFAYISNGNIVITTDMGDATLQIVDVMGRVVASYGGHTRCVSTSGMTAGVYVLRLIDGENVRTQKIVVE